MRTRIALMTCPLVACLMAGCVDPGSPAVTESTEKVAAPEKPASRKSKKPDRASAPKTGLRATPIND
jgi:hypothetical protein